MTYYGKILKMVSSERKISAFGYAIILLIAILTAIGLWQTRDSAHRLVAYEGNPERVMGTTCRIIAVVDGTCKRDVDDVLKECEQKLRNIEALMSVHLDNSEVSIFNRSESATIGISYDTCSVLENSYKMYTLSEGAFDITCSPIIDLWKEASKQGHLPDESELQRAKEKSNWDLIEIDKSQSHVKKMSDSVEIDLGGIAKGYAIDEALNIICNAGLKGGLVDIGGDIRCWGESPDGLWKIDIRNPFNDGVCAQLGLSHGAVCTSGNYNRYFEIDGVKYSHIIDPRTGMPADAVPSVTVIGISTPFADAWATALSVLGKDGLSLDTLDGDAMIITGSDDNCKVYMTEKFSDYLISDFPDEWEVTVIH